MGLFQFPDKHNLTNTRGQKNDNTAKLSGMSRS